MCRATGTPTHPTPPHPTCVVGLQMPAPGGSKGVSGGFLGGGVRWPVKASIRGYIVSPQFTCRGARTPVLRNVTLFGNRVRVSLADVLRPRVRWAALRCDRVPMSRGGPLRTRTRRGGECLAKTRAGGPSAHLGTRGAAGSPPVEGAGPVHTWIRDMGRFRPSAAGLSTLSTDPAN